MRDECAWWAEIEALGPPSKVNGKQRFDSVVIGGGFTGLACARRLAELDAGSSVAVVEASRIGAANSGRNSGFLLDVSFYDALPAPVQAAKNRLQTAGLKYLAGLVEHHGIDCDWHPWGNLYGEFDERETPHVDRLAERYANHGAAVEEWDREKMISVTGSPRMRRGVFHPGSVLVQPAKLARGLAGSLPENVTVFEESPVERYERASGDYTVRTREGVIRAKALFVCANGGTPALGLGSSRLVPVATFAAVTPSLSGADELLDQAKPFGMLPSLVGGPTIRLLTGHRLLVRSRYAFDPYAGPSRAAFDDFIASAREDVRRRWPALGEVRFDYVWSGVMALTRNTATLFGRNRDGVYVTAFCNGAGNTAGTAAGRLLAEYSAGLESDLLADQLDMPQPSWVPPDFILKPFVGREIAKSDRELQAVYG